jgi:CheY-like chemotaxis protein
LTKKSKIQAIQLIFSIKSNEAIIIRNSLVILTLKYSNSFDFDQNRQDRFNNMGLREVLLVEDDRVDALLVKKAFRSLKITNPIHHVENGEEALEFLQDSENNKPWIILLDINMPRMNGIEFLEEAKKDEDMRNIPVIVLTSSVEQRDRIDAFKFGIAGYMVKPVTYSDMLELVEAIKKYWTMSELPY